MHRYCSWALAPWIPFAAAFGQEAPPPVPAPQAEVQKTKESYEERIRLLEERLRMLEEAAAAARQDDELDELIRQAEAAGPPPAVRPSSQQSLLNPRISVIPDFTALFRSVEGDDRVRDAFEELFEEPNPFSLREVEIDLRAPVAPGADAVAMLAVSDEESAFEEAYVVLHDLPWELAAKVGRFKLDFGRANVTHQHDLPQIDRPLVHALLFGAEGTAVDGVSLERPLWSAEPGGWAPAWSDVTVEVFNASHEESPLFGTEPDQEIAAGGRLKNFWQLDETSDLEVGASGLLIGERKTEDGDQGEASALGLDVTWRHADPEPGSFRDWLVQAEVVGSSVDEADDGDDVDALGAYLTVQRRIDSQRYVGVRLDSAESPLVADAEVWAISPYLTWYLNEFLRLRIQYQYLDGSVENDSASAHSLGLQLTWVFGAHPPEPYWVNK